MSLIGAFKDTEKTECEAEAAILVSLQDEERARYVTGWSVHIHTEAFCTHCVYVCVCMSCSPAVKIKDDQLNE